MSIIYIIFMQAKYLKISPFISFLLVLQTKEYISSPPLLRVGSTRVVRVVSYRSRVQIPRHPAANFLDYLSN